MTDSITVWTADLPDYSLLDSGNGRKLERVGETIIERGEPRAWWKPSLPETEWKKASASFSRENTSGWAIKKGTASEFTIKAGTLTAKIRFAGNSKHIGIFPEQSSQWEWIGDKVKGAISENREANILSLFGYTGMATLSAAAAGASVTHVDGSKQAIDWARENQELSGLSERPVRWILDDVLRFIKKEAKQGKKYDGIIMDPPSFGRGPKGEVWKLEENIEELLSACRELLSETPVFVILNMYSIDLSSLSLENLLTDTMKGLGGRIERGELALEEKASKRLLPLSLSARWSRE